MTSYQELETSYRSQPPVVFSLALSILFECGSKTLLSTGCPELTSSLLSGEIKESVYETAILLADTPSDVLYAFVQRLLPPFEDPNGERIPFLHECNDAEDTCPLCGEDIEYDGFKEDDDMGCTRRWSCPNCGATGASGYDECFVRHYNVCDAEGKTIPGRPE